MKPIRPWIDVRGDTIERVMHGAGQLRGFSKSRCVWCFGFLRGSYHAEAYGVKVNCFQWVLTTMSGRTLAQHYGFNYDLPKRFKKILKAKL